MAHAECTSGDLEVSGSHLLLAVGRRPNTDDLGLEKAGIAVDKHGYIVVDDDSEIVGADLLDHDSCRLEVTASRLTRCTSTLRSDVPA